MSRTKLWESQKRSSQSSLLVSMTMIVCPILVVIFLVVSCTGKKAAAPPATLSSPPITRPPDPTSTPIPTVVEPGLAYGIPCKPPCWQGLTPGESTLEEAVQVMEQLRDSERVYHIQDNLPWQYDVYPLPATSAGVIHVTIKDDTVVEIGGTTLFYYPVETLVEQFGSPEGLYLITKGSTVCSSCDEWEPPEPPDMPVMSVPAHLLYPKQGLRFSILVPLSGLGCICPEMKIVGFRYYTPTIMREALAEFDRVTEEGLVEWHGFEGGY